MPPAASILRKAGRTGLPEIPRRFEKNVRKYGFVLHEKAERNRKKGAF